MLSDMHNYEKLIIWQKAMDKAVDVSKKLNLVRYDLIHPLVSQLLEVSSMNFSLQKTLKSN